MRTKREQALLEVLEGAALEHGFELVDVEFTGSGAARVVRVYLDRAAEDGGLNIDVLAAANAWVDPLVEAAEPSAGRYTLEVSSPGIDRPLRTLAHFARFVGETAHLTTDPIGGRGSWTGELAGLEESESEENPVVLITIEGEQRRIPFGAIRKARLKGRIDFTKGSRTDEREEDVI